jgi:hypothetical protein
MNNQTNGEIDEVEVAAHRYICYITYITTPIKCGLLPTTLFVLQAGFLPFSTHCMRRTSVSGLVSAFPSPPLLLYGRGIGMRK